MFALPSIARAGRRLHAGLRQSRHLFTTLDGVITEYGLVNRIADSTPAQTIMIVSEARTSTSDTSMFVLQAQRKYEEFETVWAILGAHVGLTNGYVALIKGFPRKTVFRLKGGLVTRM